MTVLINGVADQIPKTLLTTIGDIIGASAVNTPVRIAAPASGLVFTGQGAGVLPAWAAAAGAVVLLKANSGTNTTDAAGTSLDTIAISGLTALDTLLVFLTFTAVTALVKAPYLYHVTDSVKLFQVNGAANISATQIQECHAIIRPGKDNATSYQTLAHQGINTTRANGPAAGTVQTWSAAGATSFLGSWTLGLRHDGVDPTGTLHWSWAVYKVAGQ